ncbi:MAG TPA: excisionase family DNA-binding protein [Baekduia sp.]|nr:excisionase family DNA-binding protein [Baekduia sp.]
MTGSVPLALPPEALDAIAARVADLLGERAAAGSPWMSAEQAADYIAAPVSRIRKLTMTGELPHHRDGRRVLYHRDELDRFVRQGGAISP